MPRKANGAAIISLDTGGWVTDHDHIWAGSYVTFLERGYTVFHVIHGSAPKRAGLNMANPIATILSTAMMLRHSMALEKEAQAVEKAVLKVLEAGYRTYDIMEDGKTKLGTREMGDVIAKAMKA
jgi:isocitrate/isopropylmalate dehydrogenase